jgi:hypothetical protein
MNSIRAIAIFPKQFELQGFLSSLKSEDYLVSNSEDDKRECYTVKIRIAGLDLFLTIQCYVINSSDIEFSFDLGKLLEEAREDIISNSKNKVAQGAKIILPKLFVFLVGTAGTSNYPEHKLGQAFHVTTAIKVDRGSITCENKKLVMKGTKKSYSHSRPDLGLATAISTNHVAHCKSEDLFYSSEERQIADIRNTETMDAAKSYLMDMETFEFFKTCELNNVNCYQCFRMVSDVFVNNDLVAISDKTRKCVNFDKLRDLFFSYLRASLGHVSGQMSWGDILKICPHWPQHHTFLIDRINTARKEKLKKILNPTLAREVIVYADTVGIAAPDQLFELVDELAKPVPADSEQNKNNKKQRRDAEQNQH